MKQYITSLQYIELTDEQQKRLKGIWKPNIHDIVVFENTGMIRSLEVGGDVKYTQKHKEETIPLLSIGQMIEILDAYCKSNNYYDYSFWNDELDGKWHVSLWMNRKEGLEFDETELCDALWKAIKAIL